ncbi:MAG: aldehyde dehydrogenase family protein, partial [Betaproteobacteria bacterium]
MPTALNLPAQRDLYHGGGWHAPRAGGYAELTSPGSGEPLGRVAVATAADVDAAVASARAGFREWASVLPSERAKVLKRIAALLRQHAEELALIDAADCGNPVRE